MLTPGPRLVAAEGVALGLVRAESGRATDLVSFVPERGSVKFVLLFVTAIGDGGFVPLCTDKEGGALDPVFPESRPEGAFVATPAIWTPGWAVFVPVFPEPRAAREFGPVPPAGALVSGDNVGTAGMFKCPNGFLPTTRRPT